MRLIRVMFKVVGAPEPKRIGVLELPAVPRADETFEYNEQVYRVHNVVWMPQEPVFDVYVVLRMP